MADGYTPERMREMREILSMWRIAIEPRRRALWALFGAEFVEYMFRHTVRILSETEVDDG